MYICDLLQGKHAINAEHWVANVPHGSDRARRLAEDHGLNFLGEVIPDTNLFHFSGKDHHRSKRDLADLQQRLLDHPGNPLDILANLVYFFREPYLPHGPVL